MTATTIGASRPERAEAATEPRRGRRLFGLAVVVVAFVTSIGAFLILTGQTPIAPSPLVVRVAGIVNGLVVLLLIGVIGYEAALLWIARRRGRAAARLHVRIVALFSVIAALPAVLMAVIAWFTLDKGLDRWFAERTQAIIETSRTVSQAYVQEHSRVLAIDLLAIAGEFNRVRPDLAQNAEAIAAYLTNQAYLRGLSAVELVRRDGSILIAGETTTNLDVPPPPASAFFETETGRPSLIAPGTTNLVGGLVKLAGFDDVYLYLARPIDPRVTRYVRLTEENADEYSQLQENRFGVQVAFAMLFLGMALVILLSATWIGLGFANRLVAPIRRLISAASEISAGNLSVAVPVQRSAGDIGILAETFNRMTGQLKGHRDELLAANNELSERRRFIEAVLSGVSAGVIGLDPAGKVTLVNRSALAALQMQSGELLDRPLAEAVPELAPVVGEALGRSRGPSRDQIHIVRGGEPRTLNVQVTLERSGPRLDGLVVTLDDITDLVAAQRRSAWADVARRIAHEIKNPLTPIQLSAERIRRRYGRQLAGEDRAIFDQCTETIVRQVGDIRRMVDEFSAFARMPKPVIEERDLIEVVREAAFLQEVSNTAIGFRLELPEGPLLVPIDHRLVNQALTNIIKNAVEAIEAVPAAERDPGEIVVRVAEEEGQVAVEVEDNGKGLPPPQDRERLLEPYMTTRDKGTGLGLAIVRKIMEEHGGAIALLDARAGPGGRGALVRLVFPAAPQERAVGEEAPAAAVG